MLLGFEFYYKSRNFWSLLQLIYQRRDLTADQWRSTQYLSIIGEPAKLMEPARSETVPCEYLSLDTMQRWVILGFLLIHQQVGYTLPYIARVTQCRRTLIKIKPSMTTIISVVY